MVFVARYEGRCDDCREPIRVGERIVQKPSGGYAHEVCPDGPEEFGLKAGEVVCDVCWLVKPCACEVA